MAAISRAFNSAVDYAINISDNTLYNPACPSVIRNTAEYVADAVDGAIGYTSDAISHALGPIADAAIVAKDYAVDTVATASNGISRRVTRIRESRTNQISLDRECAFGESPLMQRIHNVQPPTCNERIGRIFTRFYNYVAPQAYQIETDHLAQCALDGTIDQHYNMVLFARTIDVWNSRASFIMNEAPDHTLAINEPIHTYYQTPEGAIDTTNLRQFGEYIKIREAECTYVER
jgi:hypothetical protein